MSNIHGFDFLRTEHLDEEARARIYGGKGGRGQTEEDEPGSHFVPLSAEHLEAVKNKPDLEKQFDILAFLQAHRGSGCLAPAVIYKATGIDLDVEDAVREMLQRNPKVQVELVPDPENPALLIATYAYQAKYSTVRDRTTLLAQINQMTSGISMRDLLDSYQGVEKDLAALITAGDIMAVANTEDKDKILFPRGESFLVELDGNLALPASAIVVPPKSPLGKNGNSSKQNTSKDSDDDDDDDDDDTKNKSKNGNKKNGVNSSDKGSSPKQQQQVRFKECFLVETDLDLRKQIRRGEAVQVGGQWFRVSSAVKEGLSLSEQPARAQAPLSVVSLTDMPKRNELDGYIRPFTNKILPVDAALSQPAMQNIMAAKVARERLSRLAHLGRVSGVTAGGVGGSSSSAAGVAGQLMSNYAHASNPITLAASFASSVAMANNSSSASSRKRPNAAVNGQQDQQQKEKEQQQQQQQENPEEEEFSREALIKAAADPALSLFSHARRHGCTKDVREMYLATRSLVPEADEDLKKLLVEHKLLDPDEAMRQPRMPKSSNVDNDGKPKKRRYYERKNQRMTNTHLEGTKIGAVLARAAEKQRQGKAVGDGGM